MPKCVLVVDDDPVSGGLIKRTLENNGYEAITAKNGLEALDALNKKIPDLILFPQYNSHVF